MPPSALNNMLLDNRLLAELYGHSLVEGQGKFAWMGGRAKPILIVVNNEKNAYLSKEDLPFFTRMLNACKLTLDEVALFNLAAHPALNQEEWLSFFAPRIVLCFGLSPTQLGLPVDFPLYQLQALKGCTFMHSAPFEKLASDLEERKQCWNSLKRLFNL
jgi:hypothetical protein